MAGITPTGGIRPPMVTPGAAGAADKAPAQQPGFGKVLRAYVDQVDGTQQSSHETLKNFIAGRSDDVLPVVNAVAKADLSFKLLMGVRNKVIEAYKQTMNMQV